MRSCWQSMFSVLEEGDDVRLMTITTSSKTAFPYFPLDITNWLMGINRLYQCNGIGGKFSLWRRNDDKLRCSYLFSVADHIAIHGLYKLESSFNGMIFNFLWFFRIAIFCSLWFYISLIFLDFQTCLKIQCGFFEEEV